MLAKTAIGTEAERIAFGRRVFDRMVSKGWNQAELARRAGLTRDSISTYIKGKVLPTEANRHRLAETLGCAPADLWPADGEMGVRPQESVVQAVTVSARGEPRVWLRVDRQVSLKTALAVAKLLEEEGENGAAA